MTVVSQCEYQSLREQGSFKAMVYRVTVDHSLKATLKMGPWREHSFRYATLKAGHADGYVSPGEVMLQSDFQLEG